MSALRPWSAVSGVALVLALVVPASAHHAREAAGSLVGVSVEVDGWSAPLYAAVDGTGRFYFEARQGAQYVVRLANHTRERLGVVVVVDGLNVISGDRDPGPDRGYWSRPGRMYVLDPWDTTVVRGWRTSMDEVRQFTFVDERASYAARSGKANGKMGWVEVVVYREHRPYAWRRWYDRITGSDRDRAAGGAPSGKRSEPAPADESADERPPATMPPTAQAAPESRDRAEAMSREDQEKLRGLGYAEGGSAPRPQRSYPGTGWGAPAADPVQEVEFEPEARPAESVTLRYEYPGALRALGIWPQPYDRDRLAEREHGTDGFAKPPRW